MSPSFFTHQAKGQIPAQDWQVDFTHIPLVRRFKYLLSFASTFSGWVEAFPATSEKATEIVKALTEHLIFHFGLPTSLQLDPGPAFISKVNQGAATALQIYWNLHIPYHPQSSGKVEKINSVLNQHLTKS